MGILLIDSSSEKIQFGFSIENKLVLNEVTDPGSNADSLTFHIRSSFNRKNISLKEIEIVSLSNGPGSFTGLRIGSSVSKGICFSTGSSFIEIPTLDIIANKYKNAERVVSLIFSNTRTLEFYYCGYEFVNDKLRRITDYETSDIEHILSQSKTAFVINEKNKSIIPDKYSGIIKDVSSFSDIESQLELTIEAISRKRFSNYKTSEPFYMKDFIPNN